jgi:hypothetical protein
LEMLYFLGIGGLVKISANSAFLEKSTWNIRYYIITKVIVQKQLSTNGHGTTDL